jgi:uncharacterized protein
MPYGFMDIARTPGVAQVQVELGVDHLWQDYAGPRTFDRFTDNERAHIAERDTFYLATVSETGWPYVQHRGGPRGFLKVVDDQTLAFADYRGNRQYLSLGNLATNDRASIILMDYPHRRRLKLLGHMRAVPVDGPLAALVTDLAKALQPERIMVFTLDAFDWNCPKYITPRYTEAEIAVAVRPLQKRLQQLEQQNADLVERLSAQQEGDRS